MCALASSASLANAAVMCGLSQPATSRLLMQLERDLGVTLFLRSRQGVTPTRYGEALIRHAQGVMDKLEQGRAEIHAIEEGRAGRLRIGAAHWIAPHWTSLAVRQLKTRYPHLTVEVTMEAQPVLVSRLHARTLDLVLAGPPADAHDGRALAFMPLGVQALAVYARAGHPLAAQASAGLSRWRDCAWVAVPSDAGPLADDRASWPFHASDAPAELMENVDVHTAVGLLLGSDMLGVLPQGAVDPLVAAGLLCVLEPPCVPAGPAFGTLVARGVTARAPLSFLQQALHNHAAARMPIQDQAGHNPHNRF